MRQFILKNDIIRECKCEQTIDRDLTLNNNRWEVLYSISYLFVEKLLLFLKWTLIIYFPYSYLFHNYTSYINTKTAMSMADITHDLWGKKNRSWKIWNIVFTWSLLVPFKELRRSNVVVLIKRKKSLKVVFFGYKWKLYETTQK